MTLTRESKALLESAAYVCNELDWKCVPLAGLSDRLAAIEAAVRAEQAAEVERLRAALLSVYSVHGPSGLDCECKGCVWYRAALAPTPVAPAPNSAPNPPAPHRCRECDDGPNLSFPEPTHAPPAPGERCAWRGVGTGTCGSVKEHPRHSHRGGDACEDESGECSRDFAYCHPFQPEPAP